MTNEIVEMVSNLTKNGSMINASTNSIYKKIVNGFEKFNNIRNEAMFIKDSETRILESNSPRFGAAAKENKI